jgi:ribonuclease P protein component
MLPKNQRVPRKMFPLLSNGAKVFKNGLFLLKFVPQNGNSSRFCFSISKKVAKSAVVRNRLRRAGYRALEKYIPQIKSKIIAVFSFRTVSQGGDIEKSLGSILKESKLIPLGGTNKIK